MIWEIIDIRKTGKVFRLSQDAILLVENDNNPLAFVAGPCDNEGLEYARETLEKYEDPILYCDLIYHPFFVKKKWKFHLRAEFILKSLIPFNISEKQVKVIPVATEDIFNKCLQYISLTKYASPQIFLENAMGYALFIGNEVGAVVYATISYGCAEINIATNLSYQRNGYAVQLTSYFINKCYENNITPAWSCEVSNIASFRTALKLGFVPRSYYTTMTPSFGNVLCSDLAKWLRTNGDYQ